MIVTLTMHRHNGWAGRVRAFLWMGTARLALARLQAKGLLHWKLMGTGSGEGFSTRPDFGTYTLICMWADEDAARMALSDAEPFNRYRRHSDECVTLTLEPTQSRGVWDGRPVFGEDGFAAPSGVIVALTRATLRLRHLAAFWSKVPAISDVAAAETRQHFMTGMGEIPWLHQVTFSIWSDEAAMRAFSIHSRTHGEAVKLAYSKGWFSEYLFARFNLKRIDGRWTALEEVQGLLRAEAWRPANADLRPHTESAA